MTRENITRNDCSTLATDSSNVTCPLPSLEQKAWTPWEYYAALNVYNVRRQLMVWSEAISVASSRPGLEEVLAKLPEPRNPSGFLQTIITEYGVNPEVDETIIQLLSLPSGRPVAAAAGAISGLPGMLGSVGSGGVAGLPIDGVDEWVPLLTSRLADALSSVMKIFDDFLDLVRGGSFSGNDLATEAVLASALSAGSG